MSCKFLMEYKKKELLFNRILTGRLPLLPIKSCPVDRHDEARVNDEKLRKKLKDYADAKQKVKESEIKVSDIVICKQNKLHKFSTKFEANPRTVVTVQGSKIVAKRGRHYMNRNSSFFKKISPKADSHPDDDDNDDYIPRNDDVNDRKQ